MRTVLERKEIFISLNHFVGLNNILQFGSSAAASLEVLSSAGPGYTWQHDRRAAAAAVAHWHFIATIPVTVVTCCGSDGGRGHPKEWPALANMLYHVK